MDQSAPHRRALLLTNTRARQGNEPIDKLIAQLNHGGITTKVKDLNALTQLNPVPGHLNMEYDLLIICGGDGSIMRAAPLAIKSNLPIGIIPMGTANDLARTLSIPVELDQSADIILAGKAAEIDVGTVNGIPFFNVASIGMSSRLAQDLAPETKKRLGRLSYIISALKVLVTAKRFRASIKTRTQEVKVRSYQIAVGNGVHYGGGNVIAENAKIDDGLFNLYSLEMTNIWKIAFMMVSFRSGRHGSWEEVRTAQSDEIELSTTKPMSINADGEIVTSTPARFKLLPKAVNVFVP